MIPLNETSYMSETQTRRAIFKNHQFMDPLPA